MMIACAMRWQASLLLGARYTQGTDGRATLSRDPFYHTLAEPSAGMFLKIRVCRSRGVPSSGKERGWASAGAPAPINSLPPNSTKPRLKHFRELGKYATIMNINHMQAVIFKPIR